MVNDLDTTVGNWHKCALNRAGLKGRHHLKLFLASEPLEFVAMGILGLLPKPHLGTSSSSS